MIKLGDYNTLRVVKSVDFGLYLDGGENGEILLPSRYVPKEIANGTVPQKAANGTVPQKAAIGTVLNETVSDGSPVGKELEVFIYLDQDERLIATTEHPLVKVGEFAWLECAWTNEYGAFLNWGLMKDLFCPFREQKVRMERGKKYYVYVMEDQKTHRLMATAKVERYQKMTGYERALDFTEVLLQYLRDNNGRCNLGDKSPAELIEDRFKVSKKIYKRAIGDLYKRRLITIEPDGIRLV